MNSHERDERAYVLERDRECVLFKRDSTHVCRRIGSRHLPTNRNFLTVEHVKDQPRMGKRAPSDRRHMVAMCWDANVAVPNREVRNWIRNYLKEVEG